MFGLLAIKLFADDRKRRSQIDPGEVLACAVIVLGTALAFIARVRVSDAIRLVLSPAPTCWSLLSLAILGLFFFGLFGALGRR